MGPVNTSPAGLRQRREPSSGDRVERVALKEVGQSARGEIAALGNSRGAVINDQLIGAQVDRGLDRKRFRGQEIRRAGRAVAYRGQQDHVAGRQQGAHDIRLNPARLTGAKLIDTGNDARRLRSHQVATDQRDVPVAQRALGNPGREQCLKLRACCIGGTLGRFEIVVSERAVDFACRTMDDDQTHTEDIEQRQIVNDVDESFRGQGIRAEHHDEGPAAVGANIRRGGAEPLRVGVGHGRYRRYRRYRRSTGNSGRSAW